MYIAGILPVTGSFWYMMVICLPHYVYIHFDLWL